MVETDISGVNLNVARYAAVFSAAERVMLPAFAGSTWRGAFGHALKKVLCVTGLPQCQSCPMYRACGYTYVFETPLPPDSAKMRKYTSVPHPFVFQISQPTPDVLQRGDQYILGLSLIGPANKHIDGIVEGLRVAGQGGIGSGKGRLDFVSMHQLDPVAGDWHQVSGTSGIARVFNFPIPSLPPLPSTVEIDFISPVRIKHQGKIVREEEFSFGVMFSALLRRLSMLSYFHSDTTLETNFAELVAWGREIQLQSNALAWYEWSRFSSRQNRKMNASGLKGKICISGSDIETFWPYLWLGQYVHVGALASMGLGQYTINSASLQNLTVPGAVSKMARHEH